MSLGMAPPAAAAPKRALAQSGPVQTNRPASGSSPGPAPKQGTLQRVRSQTTVPGAPGFQSVAPEGETKKEKAARLKEEKKQAKLYLKQKKRDDKLRAKEQKKDRNF